MNVMSGHGQERWRHHSSPVCSALSPPLCSQTSARCWNGERTEQCQGSDRQREFSVILVNERKVRREKKVGRQRRGTTCEKNWGESEEELKCGWEKGEVSGHRAHHCIAHKPLVTGHRRWCTHTLQSTGTVAPHTCSHTFSSLQHLTPAALLLTDIFSLFFISDSVFPRCLVHKQACAYT